MARILLVDDDGASRDMVSRALTSDGHQVQIKQDGGEALECLQGTDAFDLLITDVQMPVIDGISLAEKALRLRPQLRVILMSGYTSELDRAQQLECAGLGVVSKPFSLEQIRAAVRKALEAR